MGNSIYTIFMPRAAFSRDANAELVARALNQLDIPADVNTRHDIVVDGFKVSGSAYKLTSRRAYHHGTMLIDTDIEMLKGALKVDKDRLITKGVASVPSPVTNLRAYSYTIDHQQFCEAVIEEFFEAYNHGNAVEPTVFAKNDLSNLPEDVVKSREELTSWDWIYGQTPEFTHDIDMEFSWGTVVCFYDIHRRISRRHVIYLILSWNIERFHSVKARYNNRDRTIIVAHRGSGSHSYFSY